MKIGEILRYARPYSHVEAVMDGLPNYFHSTYTKGHKLALLEAGINPIQKIQAVDFRRCPAILISSSPHKAGLEETPWQDTFDPDHGHVRYFGDNKKPQLDPALAEGNKALLEQYELHAATSRERRLHACPILAFKRVAVENRIKGNVQFQGFGLIERVERVTQHDWRSQTSFTNYSFDFAILHLEAENEVFSWDWISARRNAQLSAEETLAVAPQSWRNWVDGGGKALERCRRRVVRLRTQKADAQKPRDGSREARALREIYEFYAGKKSRFEALAALVAEHVIAETGTRYRPGWITPASSDGGADFIGRMDVGSGFATAKIIVLGQAKCENLGSPTGGNHIARTVARLRRGWVGVYVTTSFFSEAVQREVLEDKYPILLINGLKVAQVVLQLVHDRGLTDVHSLLNEVDAQYDRQVMQRGAEEILYD